MILILGVCYGLVHLLLIMFRLYLKRMLMCSEFSVWLSVCLQLSVCLSVCTLMWRMILCAI